MHMHITARDFIVWVAFFLIWKMLLTIIVARYPENSFAKALGALS